MAVRWIEQDIVKSARLARLGVLLHEFLDESVQRRHGVRGVMTWLQGDLVVHENGNGFAVAHLDVKSVRASHLLDAVVHVIIARPMLFPSSLGLGEQRGGKRHGWVKPDLNADCSQR